MVGVKCQGVKDRLGFSVPCLPQTHMALWYPSWHRKTELVSITVEITFIVNSVYEGLGLEGLGVGGVVPPKLFF